MSKLVHKVNWNLPNSKSQELYMYGEANFEANQAMQEPLEKLYQYENQSDMRENVREYIDELEKEIKRCEQYIIDNEEDAPKVSQMMLGRVQTLQEVRNDLLGRLEEVV